MMRAVESLGHAAVQIEGACEHAFTLEPASLPWLEAVLPVLAKRGGLLVVVGGGRSGVEAAASFADRHPGLRVLLVTRGEVAPACTPAVREHVRALLRRLGVELREQLAVEGVQRDHLATARGQIAFSACLWAVARAVPGRRTSATVRAKIAS